MEKKDYFEATIRDKNNITIPKKVVDILEAKVGDSLVFRPAGKQMIVGLLHRDIIEMNINFEIKGHDQRSKSNSD